jgi:hypothetical protein
VELYFHSPNTPSWCGAQLKHRDNFTADVTTYGCSLIEKNEMDKILNSKNNKFLQNLKQEVLNGRHYFIDLGLDGRIILNYIL